jgi:MFS family permease
VILQIYTIIHTLISLVAIFTGFVVLFGMLAGRRLDGWTKWFLITAVATTITGFFFPFHGFTPAIGLGIISLPFLALTIFARYPKHLTGAWRWIYAIGAVICLYFNLFVLVVQLFEKVPALHALAPTQTEPPFKLTQLSVLGLFSVLGFVAALRFRPEPARLA